MVFPFSYGFSHLFSAVSHVLGHDLTRTGTVLMNMLERLLETTHIDAVDAGRTQEEDRCKNRL